jgi:hypothetical protein
MMCKSGEARTEGCSHRKDAKGAKRHSRNQKRRNDGNLAKRGTSRGSATDFTDYTDDENLFRGNGEKVKRGSGN